MSLELDMRALMREVAREVYREEVGRRPTELERELLTLEQAADLVSVSKTTVRRWTKQGLASTGEGKLRRVRSEDVLNYVKGGACSTAATPIEKNATVTSILASLPGRR